MVPFSVTSSDSQPRFQGHGVIVDVLCAQLTRDLFAIAKFLFITYNYHEALSFLVLTRDIDIAILSVCLTVRPSVTFRYRIISKWLNISSYFSQHTVARSFWFSITSSQNSDVIPLRGGVNTDGAYKFRDFAVSWSSSGRNQDSKSVTNVSSREKLSP